MKKTDPFSGIPAVPNSLAGQWLAFSHMANHYRKLLNVKPRVDSAAPKISSALIVQPSISGNNVIPKKPIVKKKAGSLKKSIPNKSNINIQTSEPFSAESSIDSPPEFSPRSPLLGNHSSVNKRPRKKITKNPVSRDFYSQAIDYQVVFGPSSLKSSTDALVSDCESQPDKPRVETMGVAEKIKVFLDQLHEFDDPSPVPLIKMKNNPLPHKKTLKKPKQPKENSGSSSIINSSNHHHCSACAVKTIPPTITKAVDARLSRHSKCFLPCECDCPKKAVKKKSLPPPPTSPKTPMQNRLKDEISKTKFTKSGSNLSNITGTKSYKQIVRNDSRSVAGISVNKGQKKRYISGGSVRSVGTFRGSDELTTEDNMLMIPLSEAFSINHELETSNLAKKIPENRNPTMNQKAKPGILRSRTSSAGYGSQSLSGKATVTSLLSSLGVINNKDSSRDSAYGFSSGESRITTRESTPEKMTTAYHEIKSRKSADKTTSPENKKSNNSVSITSFRKKSKEKTSESEPAEDQYLNFLTSVTEDIVNRGIYTNKGLKILFKSHLEKHIGLDPSKMTEMLEKLRMDLGIPKDDTLNKLEFGYGSVLYTTDSYNYKNGHSSEVEKSHIHSSISSEKLLPGIKSDSMRLLDERILFEESNSSSERDVNGSEIDVRSSKSDLSLSDAELKLTLKEVGIDSETTLEIVEIMKYHHKGRNHIKDISSDDYSWNSCKPTRIKPSNRRDQFTSDQSNETHLRNCSRSGSPCSTSSQ